MRLFGLRTALFGWALLFASWSFAQTSQEEWDKLLDAARKEKRILVSIPASAEFRKQLEEKFNKNLALRSKYSRGAEAPRCGV